MAPKKARSRTAPEDPTESNKVVAKAAPHWTETIEAMTNRAARLVVASMAAVSLTIIEFSLSLIESDPLTYAQHSSNGEVWWISVADADAAFSVDLL